MSSRHRDARDSRASDAVVERRPLAAVVGLRVLAVALLMSFCAGAEAQLEVEFDSAPAAASSGEVLTLRFELRNASTMEVRVTAEADLPPGWRLLLPVQQTVLAPADRVVLLAPIVIPATARAGEYVVAVELMSDGGRATSVRRPVVIAERRSIEAFLVTSPEWGPIEGYDVVFAVRNSGNVPEEIDLEVLGNDDFEYSIGGPARLRLPPEATEEVHVHVTPPARLPAPTTSFVNLHATRGGVVVAAASATSRVAAFATAGSLQRNFEVVVEASAIYDSDPDRLLPEFPIDGILLGVSGAGRLSEHSSGELSLNLSASAGADSAENYLSYRLPEYLFELGDSTINQPLLPTETGFGITVTTPGQQHDRHWLRALTMIGENPFWQVEASRKLASGIEFSLGGRLGRAGSFAFGEVDVELLPGGNTVSLRARQALDLESIAPAVDVELDFDSRYFVASADWTYLVAGYGDSSEVDNSYSFAAVVPFHANSGEYEVNAGYWNSTESSESQGAQVELQGRGDLADWSVGYHDHRSQHDEGRTIQRNFYVRSTITSRAFSFEPRVDLKRETALETGSTAASLSGGLGARTGVLGGTLWPAVELVYDLDSRSLRQIDMAAAWEGAPFDAFELYLYGSATLLDDPQVTLAARGSGDIGADRTLTAELSYRSGEQWAHRVRAEVGIDFPLQVPLGERTDIGTVGGRFTDTSGQGIAGLDVLISGYRSATVEDGAYTFPAIPAGTHVLSVTRLEPGRVTYPALPLVLEVAPGSAQTVAIQVFHESAIEARFRAVASPVSEQEETMIAGPTEPRSVASLLQGLVVVLNGPGGTQRKLVGSDGDVEFVDLIPGEWQMSVALESVPEGFRIRPDSIDVDLTEGSVEEAVFEIEPVVRRIRFQDGGAVGN